METNAMDIQFQQDIILLGHLAADGITDAFIREYKRILTKLYNDMMRFSNLGKIRSGHYHDQAEVMRAILTRQFDKEGIDWRSWPVEVDDNNDNASC